MDPDIFRFWHRTVGTCASILGFVSNVLLLLLVLRSNHPVKQIFFQMTFVDITFLIVSALTDPLIVLINGNEFMLQNGFFRHISQHMNGIMLDLWVFGLYLSINSICVQFIFRYLILCKEKVLSMFHMACLMSVPIAIAVGTAWLYHAGFILKEGDAEFATETLKDLLLESGETKVHVSRASRSDNILFHTLAVTAFTEMGICYGIIGFCLYKIQKRLKILYTLLTHSQSRIQKQISKTLIAQAVMPLLVSVIPLGYLLFMILSGGTAFWSMIVLTMGFSWVPFTNALLTMIIVREFRPSFKNWHRVGASSSKPIFFFDTDPNGTSNTQNQGNIPSYHI